VNLKAIIAFCDYLIEKVVIFLMAFLVIDVTWQVITRYVFSSPSSFTEEIARYLLIWIGLLGAAIAYRRNMHLSFDLLLQKVEPTTVPKIQVIIHGVIFVFALLVLIIGGSNLVALTWELNQVSASLGIKLAYVYMVIPASGVLMCLYAIDFILRYKEEV